MTGIIIAIIATLLVAIAALLIPILSIISNVKKCIVVIDGNFVTRFSGKRKLHESTLKAVLKVESDPEIRALHQNSGYSEPSQKYADKKDEDLMNQYPFLFSKQADAWHINHFWLVKPFINMQLNKLDNQVRLAHTAMVEEAKKHLGCISITGDKRYMFFKKENWPFYVMICLMFFCGCKVLQINFLDSEIVKTIRIALTLLLAMSFLFTVYVYGNAYKDCRLDHDFIKKTMKDNNEIAKESNTDMSLNSDFNKGQKANADSLKESYLKSLDFAKSISDTVLKYCAAFAAIWLNVSF